MGKVGSSPAFRRNGRQNPHPPKPAPVSHLPEGFDAMTTAQRAEATARLAQNKLAEMLAAPTMPRNSVAMLGAIREAQQYGVAKPAQANTLSAPDGGPIQSTHRIEFVAPEEKP